MEEKVLPGRNIENVVVRDSFYLHDVGQLLCLVLSWEQWKTCTKLCQNAAERPHIDACRVRDSQNYLWGSIKPTLDVSIDPFILEAR